MKFKKGDIVSRFECIYADQTHYVIRNSRVGILKKVNGLITITWSESEDYMYKTGPGQSGQATDGIPFDLYYAIPEFSKTDPYPGQTVWSVSGEKATFLKVYSSQLYEVKTEGNRAGCWRKDITQFDPVSKLSELKRGDKVVKGPAWMEHWSEPYSKVGTVTQTFPVGVEVEWGDNKSGRYFYNEQRKEIMPAPKEEYPPLKVGDRVMSNPNCCLVGKLKNGVVDKVEDGLVGVLWAGTGNYSTYHYGLNGKYEIIKQDAWEESQFADLDPLALHARTLKLKSATDIIEQGYTSDELRGDFKKLMNEDYVGFPTANWRETLRNYIENAKNKHTKTIEHKKVSRVTPTIENGQRPTGRAVRCKTGRATVAIGLKCY